MDFLIDYNPLINQFSQKLLKGDKEAFINPLGVNAQDIKKVQRVLRGRLMQNYLFFQEFLENPQSNILNQQSQGQQEENDLLNSKTNFQNSINFSLITKTNNFNYEIIIHFSVNLKASSLNFVSTLMNNVRILKIQSKQLIKIMARFFLSYNAKLKEGCFYVNPMTQQISFFIQNHSTLQKISSLVRTPQKFLRMVLQQMEQITGKWNDILQNLLFLINRKTFDSLMSANAKRTKYIKSKLDLLSHKIIHSHIDAQFFNSNKVVQRFKAPSDEDRMKKASRSKYQFTKMYEHQKLFDPNLQRCLTIFVGSKNFPEKVWKAQQWDKQQLQQMVMNLHCAQFTGRYPVYSQIQILSVQRQICIFESGFSKIYAIDTMCKKQSQPAQSRARLIKKQTQYKRYTNQVEVLKMIRRQKCLFLPRYFFCQQQEHKHHIFVQFIAQSSIDRYLSTKTNYISSMTKIFLMYEIVIALRFLRDNSIVHIDLKPQNVLVKIVGDARQQVHYLIKLIDFGQSYSPKIKDNSANRGFTIPYAPVELLQKINYFDEKTDVFSFGVILYEIIFEHFPIEIMKLGKAAFRELEYLKFFAIQQEKLDFFGTRDITRLLYYLCIKCLNPEPQERPTLDWLCIILKDFVLIYEELTK